MINMIILHIGFNPNFKLFQESLSKSLVSQINNTTMLLDLNGLNIFLKVFLMKKRLENWFLETTLSFYANLCH